MKVMLTSAGLETESLKNFFVKLIRKDMMCVKALFIPTAAVDADAIAVLPKCMNDLLKCGIPVKNITVCDLHAGMTYDEIIQYDVVYICGGRTEYLLQRINETGFNKTLMAYINADKLVIGVSAGSVIFAGNLTNNLGLIDTKLDVHCPDGEQKGKTTFPLKANIRLTNIQAMLIYDTEDAEIIE